MNTIRYCCIAALAALCMYFPTIARAGEKTNQPKRILCTTFPIYQLTRNITKGSTSVTVELMIPASMGCPHDYALTPQDMAKIAAADILVINGLGMEEFMGKPIEQANPNIAIIDSSMGMENVVIHDDEEDDHHDEEHHEHAYQNADDDHDHDHEHEHHHHHGPNPHLFTSPTLSARLVENIAGRLCVLDPSGAPLYAGNAAVYARRLRELAAELAEAGAGFANNRIVESHGAFDYLGRDLNLEVVGHLQPHGRELSAAKMLELLETVREKKPALIVVEPQYPAKAGETLGSETGVPVISLDSMAQGSEDAPLDYYETIMRNNIAILQNALGVK